jgi:ribosomal protein S18 acetylase RimI-like enzyme
MSTWVIRTANPEDADRLLDLWAVAAENEGRPAEHDRQLLPALLRRDADSVLLAEAGPALIGSLIAGWDGWRAHLYRLAVLPAHRRRGVGSALLAAAEQRLVALGARRLDAMVLDANELGGAAWTAAGYHRQDDWSRWVKVVAD